MIDFLRTVSEELGYWVIGVICALILCVCFGAVLYFTGPIISCIIALVITILYTAIRMLMIR